MKLVGDRARIKQQRRFFEAHRGQALSTRVADFQLTAAKHVQVAETLAGIEAIHATQGAGVVQLRLHAEVVEDAGEAIKGRKWLHTERIATLGVR
jgi:hypothetical protein